MSLNNNGMDTMKELNDMQNTKEIAKEYYKIGIDSIDKELEKRGRVRRIENGSCCYIIGPAKSGTTLLSLKISRNIIHDFEYGSCLYFDLNNSLSESQLNEIIGDDKFKFTVIIKNCTVDYITKKVSEISLNNKHKQTHAPIAIVINSLMSLIKNEPNIDAIITLRKFVLSIKQLITNTDIILIMTDQICEDDDTSDARNHMVSVDEFLIRGLLISLSDYVIKCINVCGDNHTLNIIKPCKPLRYEYINHKIDYNS